MILRAFADIMGVRDAEHRLSPTGIMILRAVADIMGVEFSCDTTSCVLGRKSAQYTPRAGR